MKKFLIATTALASVAVVAPANAADLPVKAPPMVMPALYNWSGIYIGVEGGAVMGQRTKWFVHETDTTFEVSQDLGHPLHGGFVGGEAGFNWQAPGNRWVLGIEGGVVLGQRTKWFVHETDTTFEVSQDLGHPLHGGFVGGEAGFNWQAPGSRWVFGIEGDGNWGEIEESLSCEADDFEGPVNRACGSRISSFWTIRGRIGYAFGPRGDFLAYVTAGGAGARQSARVGTLTTPFATFEEWKNTWGWTAGIGAEYGITPWLSVKGEVLFVDLAGRDYDFAGCTIDCPDDIVTVKHNFVLARMALNWRFDWGKGKGPAPVVARY